MLWATHLAPARHSPQVGARASTSRGAPWSALNRASSWPTSSRSVTARPAGRVASGARVTITCPTRELAGAVVAVSLDPQHQVLGAEVAVAEPFGLCPGQLQGPVGVLATLNHLRYRRTCWRQSRLILCCSRRDAGELQGLVAITTVAQGDDPALAHRDHAVGAVIPTPAAVGIDHWATA